MNDTKQERIASQQQAKQVIKLDPSKLLGKTLKESTMAGEVKPVVGVKPLPDRT